MKQLIKEFGRYDLDAHLGTKLTDADKKYWKKIFNDLVKDKTVPKSFGKMSILGNKVTPDEFLKKPF